MKNDRYDEAVEVSQSIDQVALNKGTSGKDNQRLFEGGGGSSKATNSDSKDAAKGSDPRESKGLVRNEMSKSQSVLNKPFDEALEFSQSGSEESVDTSQEKSNTKTAQQQAQAQQQRANQQQLLAHQQRQQHAQAATGSTATPQQVSNTQSQPKKSMPPADSPDVSRVLAFLFITSPRPPPQGRYVNIPL